jgi:tRNA pseudouridine38-40 synthase
MLIIIKMPVKCSCWTRVAKVILYFGKVFYFYRKIIQVQRYFMELCFKGTEYHGWQYQPNAITIQQIAEETIGRFLGSKISLTGAGRTDTGVHASYFVAHFNSDSERLMPVSETIRKLNYMLPGDIAIFSIFPVGEKAHSRFSALSRTYKYFINRKKDPFRQETSCFIASKLDIDAMKKATAELFNYQDFGSFCRTNTDVRTNICNIMHAGWEEKDDMLVFTIKSNRFLRNMVRAIVGTLLRVGQNKLTIEEFKKIIEARDRREAGTSAIAQGLFLTDIEYPPDVFANKTNKPSAYFEF